MEQLEHLVNQATDNDMAWWPFAFLRPEPDVPMTNADVLALSVLLGTFAGAFMNIVALLGGTHAPSPWVLPTLGTAGFFVVYRSTVAVCWNRRAARLRGERRPAR